MTKNLFFSLLKSSPKILIFVLVNVSVLRAQTNTSYNVNTVPIGGSNSTAFGMGALNLNSGAGNTANG
jgi:hypothetical protein